MWTCITISVSLLQTFSTVHQALTNGRQSIPPLVLSRSYTGNNQVNEVRQEASYWRNLAAEVNAGHEATGSQLIFSSRSSAAELAAERCKLLKQNSSSTVLTHMLRTLNNLLLTMQVSLSAVKERFKDPKGLTNSPTSNWRLRYLFILLAVLSFAPGLVSL